MENLYSCCFCTKVPEKEIRRSVTDMIAERDGAVKMANNYSSLHKELQERFLAQLAAAGSQAEFARRIGIDQGRIAKLVSGKIKFCNLTLETVERLFPGMLTVGEPRTGEARVMSRRIQRIIDRLNDEELAELLVWLATRFPLRAKE